MVLVGARILHSSQGAIGNKCQQINNLENQQMLMEDTQQARAADNRDTVVTQDQARLVANQILDHSSIPNVPNTNTGAMASQQTLILMEL